MTFETDFVGLARAQAANREMKILSTHIEISRYYLITAVDRRERGGLQLHRKNERLADSPNPFGKSDHSRSRPARLIIERNREEARERLSTTSNKIHLPLKVRFFPTVSSDIYHVK